VVPRSTAETISVRVAIDSTRFRLISTATPESTLKSTLEQLSNLDLVDHRH
jgi:hypothetical protein